MCNMNDRVFRALSGIGVTSVGAAVGLLTSAVCLAVMAPLQPGAAGRGQQSAASTIGRFPLRTSRLELNRPTHAGAFFDVIGRRSALFGYENRSFEAWIYPLKVIDDFSLSFRREGYPLEINGDDIMGSIRVRPESTTVTYAHAAFRSSSRAASKAALRPGRHTTGFSDRSNRCTSAPRHILTTSIAIRL